MPLVENKLNRQVTNGQGYKEQKPKEEKKRAQWVGTDEPQTQNYNQKGNKDMKKVNSEANEENNIMKQKKKEDWNYLKQTLNMGQVGAGNGEMLIDP